MKNKKQDKIAKSHVDADVLLVELIYPLTSSLININNGV
jgi:hypothetical protein